MTIELAADFVYDTRLQAQMRKPNLTLEHAMGFIARNPIAAVGYRKYRHLQLETGDALRILSKAWREVTA
jgi:hypothetical protein